MDAEADCVYTQDTNNLSYALLCSFWTVTSLFHLEDIREVNEYQYTQHFFLFLYQRSLYAYAL